MSCADMCSRSDAAMALGHTKPPKKERAIERQNKRREEEKHKVREKKGENKRKEKERMIERNKRELVRVIDEFSLDELDECSRAEST